MKITKEAVAGTLESSDVMVRIAPSDGNQIDLQVNSSVAKQFGDDIKRTVLETLSKLDVTSAQVIIDDKGALECVLQARLQAAVLRAADDASVPWSKL